MAKILVASFSVMPAPDRHGVQLAHVLRALASRYEVDALTLKVEDLPFQERHTRVRMLRVPVGSGSPENLGEHVELFRRALRRQLEGAEYDGVHVRGAWEGRPVCELRKQHGLKVVLELARSIDGGARPRDADLARRWAEDEAFCLTHADLVLVPTEVARTTLTARGVKAPIELLPPGVDVDLFDYELEPPPANGDADLPVVLCAGTIAPGRGVRLLLRAMATVVAETAARLVLVGPVEPGFEPDLRSEIARSEIAGKCTVEGPVAHEDVPRVLSSATVCVAPATPEAKERPLACFPTKILEYLACRRAVVAPRSDGIATLVRDGEQALLFQPGDADELADAIGRLLRDAELRRRVADEGYRALRLTHAASGTRRRLLEAYAHVVPPTGWRQVARAPRPIGGATSDPNTSTGRTLVDLLGEPPAPDEGAGVEALIDTDEYDSIEIQGAAAHDTADVEGEAAEPTQVRIGKSARGGVADQPPPAAGAGEEESWTVAASGAAPMARAAEQRPGGDGDVDGGANETPPFAAAGALLGSSDEARESTRPMFRYDAPFDGREPTRDFPPRAGATEEDAGGEGEGQSSGDGARDGTKSQGE